MTVGENIRRIRKARGLTIKELGERIGVSESYIRAYETGRRNPKESSLQKIADVLAVNVEVLKNSDFDGITAMHRLFHIFRQYGGSLMEIPDTNDGRTSIAVTFPSLALMRSWLNRFKKYEEDIRQANAIPDNIDRANALLAAEKSFDLWMDMYPDTDMFQDIVRIQQVFDASLDRTKREPVDL